MKLFFIMKGPWEPGLTTVKFPVIWSKKLKMAPSSIEETASYDDTLMDKYLNDQEISVQEPAAIRKGIDNTFVPTLCGSAFKNKGAASIDSVVNLLPSPLMLAL